MAYRAATRRTYGRDEWFVFQGERLALGPFKTEDAARRKTAELNKEHGYPELKTLEDVVRSEPALMDLCRDLGMVQE